MIHRLLLVGMIVGAMACKARERETEPAAPSLFEGGKPLSAEAMKTASARYVLESCGAAEGSLSVDKQYELLRLPGGGAAQVIQGRAPTEITNRWEDEDGHHFFTWRGGFGFEYVVKDGADSATLKMWIVKSIEDAPDGSKRPGGLEAGTCRLQLRS